MFLMKSLCKSILCCSGTWGKLKKTEKFVSKKEIIARLGCYGIGRYV